MESRNPILETELLVLRKVPYSDHAMIYNGISPEYGRLGLLVRGGAGGLKRAFPELEPFRLLKLTFRQGGGDLAYVQEIQEVLEDFSGIANDYASFHAANWLASFSQLNIMPMLGHPHFHNALTVAFRRLANEELQPEAVLTGACLAFVFEEGWLSSVMQKPEAAAQCKQLLEMAAGLPAPVLSDECWQSQFQWVQGILLANECRLPN